MPDHIARIAALEAQVADMKADIHRIETRLENTATRNDVHALREDMRQYHELVVSNLWKVLYGLLIVVAAVVLAVLGIEALPALWGRGGLA